MAGFTEEILADARQKLVVGEEGIPEFWYAPRIVPPMSVEDFDDSVDDYRRQRRDTLELYRVIRETWDAGYECEVIIGWYGDHMPPPSKIHEVKPGEEISLDFDNLVGDDSILYRFLR